MEKVYRACRKSPSALASPDKMSLVVTLNDTGLTYVQGIISHRSETVPYDKINSVNVQQGPLENVLGYGTVVIVTGNDDEPITLVDIEKPHELRSDIVQMMEATAAHHQTSTQQATPQAPAQTPEDELVKLSALKDQGIITQQEFDLKKKQLLGI
ncbi:MAG TPA: PH domain-containing protein [Candidatus Saccharimonadia bacterium]|nr:PH domain-containing protein [Candidatus Saccharimonadia bacterium]